MRDETYVLGHDTDNTVSSVDDGGSKVLRDPQPALRPDYSIIERSCSS